MQDIEIMFPIKLEFHYPLHKNLFFTAEAGVKLKVVLIRLFYGKDATGNYRSRQTVLVRPVPDDDPNVCKTFSLILKMILTCPFFICLCVIQNIHYICRKFFIALQIKHYLL